MKKYLLRIVLACLYLSLMITCLCIASIADILAKGINGNSLTLFVDAGILICEPVIFLSIYHILAKWPCGFVNKKYNTIS